MKCDVWAVWLVSIMLKEVLKLANNAATAIVQLANHVVGQNACIKHFLHEKDGVLR